MAPASEIDSRTRLGEVYLSSLLRAQLRLSLGVLAGVAGPVVALPLLFHLVPDLTGTIVLGMPLPWVLLAFAIHPFFVVGGWFYVRRAERNERVFATMVAPHEPPEGGRP